MGLLYDNGYTTVNSLKTADIKELTKIKGLKKKTAKGIKKEIEIEDVTVNEDVLEPSDEITHEAEEKPVKFLSEEKIKKDESEELDERIIEHKPEVEIKEETFEEEEEIEDIPPIVEDADDVFKDVNSIDEKTSRLLVENDIDSIDVLKGKTIKELTAIKGIKKKTANEIKKEIDEKFEKESQDTSEESEPSEYFFEEDEDQDIDEKIKNHVPKKDEEEIFEEKEEIEDILPIVEDADDVFKDVNSIDEKTSRLLIENGINSVKTLKGKTIKELTNVRGIKKKTAKEIKKEIDAIVKRDHDKNVSYERENNPFIDESDDGEWDFLEEKSIPKEVIIGISEYRHGDYTLYEKEMATKSGKKQKVRFFSKGKPDEGKPIQLPEGYEVKENKKTGVPYIRKKK